MTIKNTLNVEGIAEITGATNLKSTLNVEGDIKGPYIEKL
jgi:cytoskeletal protein CcmA (bactofilin family)